MENGNDKMEQAHRLIKEALEPSPDIAEYLEEEAMEKHFEKKEQDKSCKNKIACEFCGFEYPADEKECPACRDSFKNEYGD